MATTKRTKTKAPVPDPDQPEAPSTLVGAAILRDFSDLAPSVARILHSDLDEPGRLRAITLFQISLGAVGDPMRIPANAIAAGRLPSPDTADGIGGTDPVPGSQAPVG